MTGRESTEAERCRLRHMHTGLYVARTLRHAASDAALVDGVRLQLDRRANAALFDRVNAGRVADAWIALTGDNRIEIEPLEG